MFWEKHRRTQVKDLMNRNLTREAKSQPPMPTSSQTESEVNTETVAKVSAGEDISDMNQKKVESITFNKEISQKSRLPHFLQFLLYAFGPWLSLGVVTWLVLDAKSDLLLILFAIVILVMYVGAAFLGGGGRNGGGNDQGWNE